MDVDDCFQIAKGADCAHSVVLSRLACVPLQGALILLFYFCFIPHFQGYLLI